MSLVIYLSVSVVVSQVYSAVYKEGQIIFTSVSYNIEILTIERVREYFYF